jgi:uncharacterized protein YcgI (DUF1989 family)
MTILSDITVPARAPYSATLKPGQIMRIVDLESQQAVDALFYNAHDTSERYSAQDTLAAQALTGGKFYLETGSILLSNEGRAMVRIIADTCGRLFLRIQHCTLWPRDPLHARLPRKFPDRARQIRHGKARPRLQRELLHERADPPER